MILNCLAVTVCVVFVHQLVSELFKIECVDRFGGGNIVRVVEFFCSNCCL